jgi:hypothetical protein
VSVSCIGVAWVVSGNAVTTSAPARATPAILPEAAEDNILRPGSDRWGDVAPGVGCERGGETWAKLRFTAAKEGAPGE